MRGIFVAGTDTGVGKTVVAGGLTRYLRDEGYEVNSIKPVESGGRDDAEFLSEASGEEVKDVCASFLEEPLAPRVAAEVEDVDLSYDGILGDVESRLSGDGFTVVEGIGGVRVPLAGDKEVIDLMEDLGLPVLVVGRPGLGTLNHTALTVEALETRGIEVTGVVLSRYPESPDTAERTNPDEIRKMTGVDLVETLPDIARDGEITPRRAADSIGSNLTTEIISQIQE